MKETTIMLKNLEIRKDTMTKQQYRTIRGQIKAGDLQGAKKGITRIIEKENHENIRFV